VHLDIAKETGNFTGCSQLTTIIFPSVAVPGLFTSVNSMILPISTIVAYSPSNRETTLPGNAGTAMQLLSVPESWLEA